MDTDADIDAIVLTLTERMVKRAIDSGTGDLFIHAEPRILQTDGSVWGGTILARIQRQTGKAIPQERAKESGV
jgi:hypothetical protein